MRHVSSRRLADLLVGIYRENRGSLAVCVTASSTDKPLLWRENLTPSSAYSCIFQLRAQNGRKKKWSPTVEPRAAHDCDQQAILHLCCTADCDSQNIIMVTAVEGAAAPRRV